MHVRDASGRQVSLLNDDPSAAMSSRHPALYTTDMPVYYGRAPRGSTSPNTPELLRSDSYDSQVSATDPLSPMTPLYDYGRYASDRHVYDDYYADPFTAHAGTKRLSVATDAQSGFYEDDAAASPSAGGSGERSAKRYPCRYRETHGCEKTFTTSGHASRHSKIHTAEKAVPCSFQGCSKKFTRADNMKQHLETHYKDKSRSSTSRPSLSSSSSSGDRRSSTSGKSSSGRKSSSSGAVSGSTPLPSPGGVWDMRGLDLPIIGRPSAIRSPSSGLDALAMAVACQEGA